MQHLHEEMADFPYGENDDLHDAAIWGLLRIRCGGYTDLACEVAN